MKEVKEEKKKKKEKKQKVIKAPKVQTIFCIISLVFVLLCCGFYGTRLVKYYKIYNPKSESGETLMNLASSIISNSSIVYEGDGLYINNGNYVYKGEEVNNYILISNMLFRIVKINTDKTIDLVLDDYINKLEWNNDITDFKDTSILSYLNNNFLDIIDKNILTTTNVCQDEVNLLSEVKCDIVDNSNYIRLLSITDFLNSINDNKTYLIKDNEFLWLNNHSKDKVWHTTGTSLANSNSTSLYGIKPVITLKNTTVLRNGDGSSNNPYQIDNNENKKIEKGTYLDLGDDIYIVYEVGEDFYKLQSNKVLSKEMAFSKKTNDYKESDLKEYLEKTYLEKLSYKDFLKEITWENEVVSKVNILNKDDLKFNSSLKNYYLSNKGNNNDVYVYNGTLLTSKVTTNRNIRPCVAISKDLKIISGNGSKLAPFIVEV